ncbi:MAG: hypothetical protein AB7I30_24335 [Isosphaeraceae bacterium]
MSDLAFHDALIPTNGPKARLLAPARRLVRKLLLPFFSRQVEILEALREGQFEGGRERDALRRDVARLRERDDRLGLRDDDLERSISDLRVAIESFHAKLAEIHEAVASIRSRQDELELSVETVVALNWDHAAMARTLARLEDRLLGDGDGSTSDGLDDDRRSLQFPGLNRDEPGNRSEAV